MGEERKWVDWRRVLLFGMKNDEGDEQEFDESLQFEQEVYET